LNELSFSQTFYDENGGTLAQTVTINLELTKVIILFVLGFIVLCVKKGDQ
jgi:hypothetical protein